MNIPHFRHIK